MNLNDDRPELVDTRDVVIDQRKKARRAVNRAVRNKMLIRPEICELCGIKPGRARNGKALIDAHHHAGYNEENWLNIIWVCQSCHQKTHARRHGIKHTDEVRALIGERVREQFQSGTRVKPDMRGEKNPFFGKNHSDETKLRISESRRGKPRTPHTKETRQKMSKPRPKVTCDLCDRVISSVWIKRHKDSGCVAA